MMLVKRAFGTREVLGFVWWEGEAPPHAARGATWRSHVFAGMQDLRFRESCVTTAVTALARDAPQAVDKDDDCVEELTPRRCPFVQTVTEQKAAPSEKGGPASPSGKDRLPFA